MLGFVEHHVCGCACACVYVSHGVVLGFVEHDVSPARASRWGLLPPGLGSGSGLGSGLGLGLGLRLGLEG